MERIKISKVSSSIHAHKGFENGPLKGCFTTCCGENKLGDACCRYGCDVDKESYDILFCNREIIEPVIGLSLDYAFKGRWFGKGNYLGGTAIRSRTRKEDGFCVFHSKNAKGCELVNLVFKKNISKRVIPTICRIYPLANKGGKLAMYDEIWKVPIEKGCNCISKTNNTKQSIFETQKNEIEEIFNID